MNIFNKIYVCRKFVRIIMRKKNHDRQRTLKDREQISQFVMNYLSNSFVVVSAPSKFSLDFYMLNQT